MKKRAEKTLSLVVWVTLLTSICSPHVGAQPSQIEYPLAVGILMDTSGSMGAADRPGASREAVFTAMDLIVHERPTIFLLEFSGQVRALVEPTELNPDKLRSIRQKMAKRQANGSTELDKGIGESLRLLRDAQLKAHRKALVILTDGQIPSEQKSMLSQYARDIQTENIEVFCIELGFPKATSSMIKAFTTEANGHFFGIESGNDLVAGSCRAAIQIAMNLMPNNIYSFMNEHSPLQIPREAQRVLAVVPNEVSLYGPGVSSSATATVMAHQSVHSTETSYAQWKVVALSRPTNSIDANQYWKGHWVAKDKYGKRVTAWAFIKTDMRVRGELVNTNAATDEHIRIAADMSLHASSTKPVGPYSVRSYLKPQKGPAYSVTEETLQGNPPKRVEMELPPVEHPGPYELVCQIANPEGVITAEHRKPIQIEPSSFHLVVYAVSKDGKKRTLAKSGLGGRPISFEIKADETVTIEVEPIVTENQKAEILSGGVTIEAEGKSPVTYKLQADSTGATPRLIYTGLEIIAPTKVRIGVRGDFIVKSNDPISGLATQLRQQSRAEWSLGLRPFEEIPQPIHVRAVYDGPTSLPQSRKHTIQFSMTATGGKQQERDKFLLTLTSLANLVVMCPDNSIIQTPSNQRLSNKRISTIQHSKSNSLLTITWDLFHPDPGEYLADLKVVSLTSLGITPDTARFTNEGGRFHVSEPWIVASVQKTNRTLTSLPLQDAITLAEGDKGKFIITPTEQVPPRIIDHMNVSVSVVLNNNKKMLNIVRVDHHWETEEVVFDKGSTHTQIRVTIPGQKPIEMASQITIRPILAHLEIHGLPNCDIPQDAILTYDVRVTPEISADLQAITQEQNIRVHLLDEANQIIFNETFHFKSNGISTVSMSLPRQGHFTMKVKMPKAKEITKRIKITEKAIAFKMLADKPRPNDSLFTLLMKSNIPPLLESQWELYPTILPTEAFPIANYRIAEAEVVINGSTFCAHNDGLHRWYLTQAWTVGKAKQVCGKLQVVLASVNGEPGIVLHQTFDLPVRIHKSIAKILLPYFVVAILAIYGLLLAYRHYFALGEILVTLTEPYLPEFDKINTKQGLLARIFWPRTHFHVGAGMGNMSLDSTLNDSDDSLLLTFHRDLRRRLLAYNHTFQQEAVLESGNNSLPSGNMLFDICV